MRIVKSDLRAAILVCAKCSRRMEGGFGPKGKSSLAKVLRKLGNGRKGRKANLAVVETGCLKLCPKNAAVAFNGATPHEWCIIARGTDPVEVARLLGVDSAEPERHALPGG